MEALQEAQDFTKTTFISHVFSTTEDGKAEVMNTIQYSTLALVPIVLLNKLIQKAIPEADLDKSSLELLVEIFMQIVIMFCGIIVIHRTITYVPTYSGFKYEAFVVTNSVLAFMILILSIQSKLGIKTNILYERAVEIWNGASEESSKKIVSKRNVRFNEQNMNHSHVPSQSDQHFEEQPQGAFLPNPVSMSRNNAAVTNQEVVADPLSTM